MMIITEEVDCDINPTELYIAICSEEWDKATSIVKDDPIQAKIWIVRHDSEDTTAILWRFLPIHSACARQPPEAFIEALLSAYNAASIIDGHGFLPLHYACGNRANEGVINTLLIINPNGATLRDPAAGKLPLHHLSLRGPYSIGVIYLLLSVYPQAVQEKDNSGYTPEDIVKLANYPGRGAVINAYKKSRRIKSVKVINYIESEGLVAKKEMEDIQLQEKTIENVKKEISLIRDENGSLRSKLNEECAGSKELVSLECVKVNKGISALECVQLDLSTMKSTHAERKHEHMTNLDNISKFEDTIVTVRKQKEQMARKCIVLQEKINLKTKMNQDTVTILKVRGEDQNMKVESYSEKVQKLENTLEQLIIDVKEIDDAKKSAKKDIKYLKECETVEYKLTEIGKCVNKLVLRYEPCNKLILKEQYEFKKQCSDRERNILELAQLEEKIRANSQMESDQISQELKEQDKEIQIIMELICGM